MKPEDILFGRRIRQNHALEHATITILSRVVPDLRVSARSSSNGFMIFGDVDLGQLRRALDEALSRLQAGEAELAIHPLPDGIAQLDREGRIGPLPRHRGQHQNRLGRGRRQLTAGCRRQQQSPDRQGQDR